MEKMVQRCGIDSVKNGIRDLIDRLLITNWSDNDVVDTVVLMNSILSEHTDKITDIPEILILTNLIKLRNTPNAIIDILSKEIEVRSIRELAMDNVIAKSEQDTNTEQKKYRDESIDINGNVDISKINTDYRKNARRFVPKNGNFQLPPPGQTGLLWNKNQDPDTGVTNVEKLLVDSEGYVVEVLDSYTETEEDKKLKEIEYEDAYTNLMKNVLDYAELNDDGDVPEATIEDARKACGDCDNCEKEETE